MDNDLSKVPEEPTSNEQVWLRWAFIVGAFSIAFVLFSAWHIFLSLESLEQREQTARIITPFLAVFGAIITFLTVAWRGTISTKQVEELAKQNESNEKADIALLFEKGYRAIGSADLNESAVGAALLKIVVDQSKPYFLEQAATAAALHLVQSLPHIVTTTDLSTGAKATSLKIPPARHDIYEILRIAHSKGVKYGSAMYIEKSMFEDDNTKIKGSLPFENFLPVARFGGLNFSLRKEWDTSEIKHVARRFVKCSFEGMDKKTSLNFPLPVDRSFTDCTFKNLAFKLEIECGTNTFNKCWLSNCEIFIDELITTPDNIFSKCFFDVEMPPIIRHRTIKHPMGIVLSKEEWGNMVSKL